MKTTAETADFLVRPVGAESAKLSTSSLGEDVPAIFDGMSDQDKKSDTAEMGNMNRDRKSVV
mgnify:FL=1